ncbi:hypothetical protein R1sor_008336 [Riccia sorocarpa]|uniref:Endonuclease/exonuclease/phosphatase n=1 Tax=Riccia sorocarpa TaxID=122646 RepID=A0ABD3HX56_9MARC
MVELPEDCRGKSALLNGAEARSWKQLARLDRIYLSHGADWIHLVAEVAHISDQVVSDHVPIIANIELTLDGENGWYPKSYFKMGSFLLGRTGVKEKLTAAWKSHPPNAGNAQRKWQLGWIRIRAILRVENRQAKAEGR